MLKQLVNEARFSLLLENTGPLLIKSGRPTLSDADMVPVEVHRNNQWEEYIPGSSLKGVFRSHLEKVARMLTDQPSAVCNPFNRDREPDIFCGQRFQERKGGRAPGPVPTNEVVYRDSCPMCRLFGSTFFIGRLSLGDAYLAPDSLPSTERRDGVGIDRLTGGAANGAKFDLRVVSPGARFVAAVTLRNFEIWQLGALLQAVQDGQEGLLQLGSGRSRGLGAITAQIATAAGAIGGATLDIHYIGAAPPAGAPAVWGLGRFLAEDRRYGTQPDDALALSSAPSESRRGVRIVQMFRGDDLAALADGAALAFAERMRAWPAPNMAAPASTPVGRRRQ